LTEEGGGERGVTGEVHDRKEEGDWGKECVFWEREENEEGGRS